MISIIVPVYNVEIFLYECLDSIINQSYDDFEVLMIDDGSTDNSSIICDEYADKDKRFKSYHKKNGGLSSARNYGIERASGEWITFIDGDDKVGIDYLKNFRVDILSQDVDHIVCKGYNANGKEKLFWETGNLYYNKNNIEEFIQHITKSSGLFLSTWSRLYKTDILRRYNIISPLGFHYAEDCCMNFEYYKHITKIYIVEDSSYFYRDNQSSLSHSFKSYYHYIQCLDIMIKHYIYYRQLFKNKKIADDYFVGFHIIGNSLSIQYDLYANKYSYDERKKAILKIRKFLAESNGVYKKYINNYIKWLKIESIYIPFGLYNIINIIIFKIKK